MEGHKRIVELNTSGDILLLKAVRLSNEQL